MPPRQLFQGLYFCFFPQPALFKINGVKAKAAAKFGAVIEGKPSQQTTHILVARESAQSRPFSKFLQAAPTNIYCIIVDNDWCSQCIDAGKLLDTVPFAVKQSSSHSSDPPLAPFNARSQELDTTIQNANKAADPNSSSGEPHVSENSVSQNAKSSVEEVSYHAVGSLPSSPRAKRITASPLLTDSPTKRAKFTRAHRENAQPNACLRGSPTPSPQTSPLASPSPPLPSTPVRVGSPKSPISDKAAEAPAPSAHANQALIDVFNDFVTARHATGDEFSARAYERALKALRSTNTTITGYEDAIKLPGITARMAQLVDDVQKGVLSLTLQNDMKKRADTLKLFETVYGVGSTKAMALYRKGYRTLEDIIPHVDSNGRYSISHHADFVERMPRSEVDVHYGKVKELVASVDGDVQTYCMGSYRRGEPDCGDIDIILTREGASVQQLKKVLRPLLDSMFATGLATHTFSIGGTRWLGATNAIGKVRRMDILLVPWQELGAAMIYYTGNSMFNREMRLSAIKQSMRLNEKGLYRLEDGGARELVEGHDERRIFELLGWTWREPHERKF